MISKQKRNCAQCGKLFPLKDVRSLYCCASCKTAAYRKRKAASEESNHNIEEDSLVEWAERTVTVEVRNPRYTQFESALQQAEAKLLSLKAEEAQLKIKQSEFQKKSLPNDSEKYYIPAFTWGGMSLLIGAAGVSIFPKPAPTEKDPKPVDFRYVAIIGFVIVAIIIGIIFTDKQHKKTEAEFPEILKRLEVLPEEIENAEKAVKMLRIELNSVPENIEREKQERYAVSKSENMPAESLQEIQETATDL
ncbi:MAG: hypothetical protein U0X91_03565 [Spirosomataceae bacterium]